jgi:hypothetical protein
MENVSLTSMSEHVISINHSIDGDVIRAIETFGIKHFSQVIQAMKFVKNIQLHQVIFGARNRKRWGDEILGFLFRDDRNTNKCE